MGYYYVGMVPYYDGLAHHGIKGQKWGVRRYQNPDGTLTAEGKARYGEDVGPRAEGRQGIIRRLATGDHFLSAKRLGEKREVRLKNKMDALRSTNPQDKKSLRKLKNMERTYNMQKQVNIDRENYISNSGTGKLVAQRILLGWAGSDYYRAAVGRGDSGVKAAGLAIVSRLIPYVGSTALPVITGAEVRSEQRAASRH